MWCFYQIKAAGLPLAGDHNDHEKDGNYVKYASTTMDRSTVAFGLLRLKYVTLRAGLCFKSHGLRYPAEGYLKDGVCSVREIKSI